MGLAKYTYKYTEDKSRIRGSIKRWKVGGLYSGDRAIEAWKMAKVRLAGVKSDPERWLDRNRSNADSSRGHGCIHRPVLKYPAWPAKLPLKLPLKSSRCSVRSESENSRSIEGKRDEKSRESWSLSLRIPNRVPSAISRITEFTGWDFDALINALSIFRPVPRRW